MLPLLAALLLATSGAPAPDAPPPAPADAQAPPSPDDEAVIENLELVRALDLLDTLELLDDAGDARDEHGAPR
jgi:hypothetical protein